MKTDTLAAIDKLVGKRRRSAFISDATEEVLMRQQQRKALKAAAGAWKDADHPELSQGAAAWVKKMRAESEERFRKIEQHRDQH
jgi:hypothetical protein